MDYHRLYRDLRAELREWVREYTATFIKLLPYTNSTASGEHDKVRGYDVEGADEEPYDFEGRRVYPFGIRSRPPAGVLGLWIGNRGRSGNGAIIGAESSRFGPSDLADGEVGIYNKATGCLIKLDHNGKITITATAGQLVEINGNTYSLPQWDSFAAALKTCTAAITALVAATDPASVITLANGIRAAFVALNTAMAGANNYKSTNAKNG